MKIASMGFAPVPTGTVVPSAPAAPANNAPHIVNAPWKNAAAAAALRSSTQMLQVIEDGIVRNYTEPSKVRVFAADLRAASDVFVAATDAISTDSSKDNDQFLPLLGRASGGVSSAETRLQSKDLTATWPNTRSDILTTIRTARMIAANVADQLDPNTRSADQ